MSLLETVIRNNYDQYMKTAQGGANLDLTSLDIQKIAIEEEYKIFSNNKVITTYRRGMAFLMAEVKSKTDKWHVHPTIKNYGQEAPAAAASSMSETSDAKYLGFKTALQLSSSQEIKARASSTTDSSSEAAGEKTKKKWKMLGLSDEDEEAAENGNPPAVVSESSSSPGFAEDKEEELPDIENPDEEVIAETVPEHHPSEKKEAEPEEPEEDEDAKLAKLEERIKLVQQQMAEGNDHISYELKLREKQKRDAKKAEESPSKKVSSPRKHSPQKQHHSPRKSKPDLGGFSASTMKAFKPPRKVSPKKSEEPELVVVPEMKVPNVFDTMAQATTWGPSDDGTDPKKRRKSKKSPQKNKIRVRVEIDNGLNVDKKNKPTKEPKVDKKAKTETADMLVKLLVPYFKTGQIASKEVFKLTARELTHNLLQMSHITKADYSTFVARFFECNGILLSDEDAKKKIAIYSKNVSKA